MEGFAYFPTIIYRDERPDLVESILPVAMEYLNEVRNDTDIFLQSKFLNKDGRITELSNYLLLNSVQILQDQGYETSEYDFYISGLWAQELKNNSGTDIHVHRNSQISGWFFLKVPEFSCYPIYYDTRINKNIIDLNIKNDEKVYHATSTIYFNNMIPGTVMFNNSWVNHKLAGGSSKEPTICIHFIISHREKLCNIY